MRILRNIIITLLLMALAVISVIGAMVELPKILSWSPTRINDLGRSFPQVMRPGNALFWLWVGIAVSCVLVFLMTIIRTRKPMRIEVQMGGGKVVIMDSAIKRYLKSALAEIPAVTVRRIDLKDTRAGVLTDIYADVRTHENLPVLERRMIQRVRAALAEDLGITGIADVHVFIRDFEVTGRQVAAARRNNAREPEADKSDPEPALIPAATGPFDQVPVPERLRMSAGEAAARHSDHHTSSGPEHFFTLGNATNKSGVRDDPPSPDSPAAEATVIPSSAAAAPTIFPAPTPVEPSPATVFTMREDKAAPSPLLPAIEGGAGNKVTPAEPAVSDTQPSANVSPAKRKGLFGLWSREETSAAPAENGPVIQEIPATDPVYNPATATESISAETAEESPEAKASKADEKP